MTLPRLSNGFESHITLQFLKAVWRSSSEAYYVYYVRHMHDEYSKDDCNVDIIPGANPGSGTIFKSGVDVNGCTPDFQSEGEGSIPSHRTNFKRPLAE